MGILVAQPLTPRLHFPAEDFFVSLRAEFQYARGFGRVEERIEFDYGNLAALGRVPDLVVGDDRRPRPSGHNVRTNVPDEGVLGSMSWKERAQDEPPILRLVACVEQHDRPAVGGNAHAGERVLWRKHYVVTRGKRNRLRASIRLTLHGAAWVTRKNSGTAVKHERLAEIGARIEIEIEPSLADQRGR